MNNRERLPPAALSTVLPPSPDLIAINPQNNKSRGSTLFDPIQKHQHQQQQQPRSSRIRSVGRYGSFEPQVLACCTNLSNNNISYNGNNQFGDNNGEENKDGEQTSKRGGKNTKDTSYMAYSFHPPDRNRLPNVTPSSSSTIGAMAGPKGVSLFKISNPSSPIMVLNHITPDVLPSEGSKVTSLAFQPKKRGGTAGGAPTLLAAAKGSGVLVWDASGNSLSPLLGRLDLDGFGGVSSRFSGVASSTVAWRGPSVPLLATSSSKFVSVWDLRSWSSRMRPCLRYSANPDSGGVAPSSLPPAFLHVACDESSHRIAALDTSGVVRVYDDRTSLRRGGSLNSFRHEGAFGLSSFPSEVDGSFWITWGSNSDCGEQQQQQQQHYQHNDEQEEIVGSGCVKVWVDSKSPLHKSSSGGALSSSSGRGDPDSYWYMGSDQQQENENEETKGEESSYVVTAQIQQQGLSCARVCPHPLANAILTVGSLPPEGTTSIDSSLSSYHWEANLWLVSGDDQSNSGEKDTKDTEEVQENILLPPTHVHYERRGEFGVDQIGTFRGGGMGDELLSQTIGVKGTDLGYMVAAELAFEPFGHLGTGNGYVGEEGERGELVLCSLTSTGYLTTHAVVEAVATSQYESKHNRNDIPMHSAPPSTISNAMKPTKQSVTPAQVIHSENSDAVSSKQRTSQQDTININQRPEVPSPPPSDNLYSTSREQQIQRVPEDTSPLTVGTPAVPPSRISPNIPPHAESLLSKSGGLRIDGAAGGGATTQYDISFHHPPEPPSIPDATDSTSAITGGGGPAGPTGQSVIDPFRAMRVPCPRPCGASFGMGGGADLVVFHNGGVNKVWSWFQSNLGGGGSGDNSRLSGAGANGGNKDGGEMTITLNHRFGAEPPQPSQQLPTPTSVFHERGSGSHVEMAGSGDSARRPNRPLETQSSSSVREYPRTMFNLMRMNAAAKYAQWGDDQNSADSNSNNDDDIEIDDDDNYSDDDSEDGSSDFEGLHDLFAVTETDDDGNKDLYDTYFSDMNRPVAVPAPPQRSSVGGDPSNKSSFSRKYTGDRRSRGRATDDSSFTEPLISQISPVVFVIEHKYNSLVLNGQCPELAARWKLGVWWLNSHVDLVQDDAFGPSNPVLKDDGDGDHEEGWRWVDESCQDETEANGEDLSKKDNYSLSPKSLHRSVSLGQSAGERKAPTTPQETMIGNLRRLFNNQNQGSVTAEPPNQNLLQQKTKEALVVTNPPQSRAQQKLGLFELTLSRQTYPSSVVLSQLQQTKQLCLHNSSVCNELGLSEKGNTWALLAQIAEQASNSFTDAFDGWGGPGGGAMGRELISNLLQYYEMHGDVQMLATMACVLSGGKDRRKTKGKKRLGSGQFDLDLLLPVDDDRYDMYIHRYSVLLYKWGQLTLRTELGKHLASTIPGAGGEEVLIKPQQEHQQEQKNKNRDRGKSNIIPNEGVAPGITFAPICPRCHVAANPESNVCDYCMDYAFRCSICTNAVRGLFTACMSCGHGGHCEHLMPWFASQSVCPTGCGCSCILKTFDPSSMSSPLEETSIQIAAEARRKFIPAVPAKGANEPNQLSIPSNPSTGSDLLLGAGLGSVPFGAYSSQPKMGSNVAVVSRIVSEG